MRDRSGDQEFVLGIRAGLNMDTNLNAEEELKAQVEKRRSAQGSSGDSANQPICTEMWTELYAPQRVQDLVGNQGAIDQLFEWLRDWDDVHVRGNKKQVQIRRGQSWADMPRVNSKAVLLSGPPGIGKTSSARIVCRQLGFEVLETNASDTRNKNAINNMLKDLSSNQSLDYFSVAGLRK